MTIPDKQPQSGDLCPLCNHGHVEIYRSPKPVEGQELRTRYLRCSCRELGCNFTGKQIVPVDEVRTRTASGIVS